jgi:hypothetical protein
MPIYQASPSRGDLLFDAECSFESALALEPDIQAYERKGEKYTAQLWRDTQTRYLERAAELEHRANEMK